MFEKFMEKFSKREEPDEMEFKTFDDLDMKDEPIIDEYEEVNARPQHEQAGTQENVELKVMRPEAYEEVSNVADSLLAGCTVVLNLEALDRHVMVRMLDFLNGVTYCTDGEIKKVAPSTFIITPHSNVDIS